MSKCKSFNEVIYFCDGKKCCRYNEEAKSCLKELLNDTGLNKNVSLEKMK